MMPVDPPQSLPDFRGLDLRMAQPAKHLAERPAWTCRTCGADWPCAAAREDMHHEYDSNPTGLATLMWTCLEHFALDHGTGPLSGAFDRFIAWTR